MIYEKTILIDDKLRRGDLDGVAEMVIGLRKEYDKLVACVRPAALTPRANPAHVFRVAHPQRRLQLRFDNDLLTFS